MKHLRFVFKSFIFLIILTMCLYSVNKILIPKFTSENGWPTTTTFINFYEMEKNTIDVLFLGSSHIASSLIPQVMYDEHGITSYNLGSEQQNMAISYFWLKEALNYQQPKAVILDCYFLELVSMNPLNSEESFTRKSIDYMRWSPTKIEAINEICKLDTQQSKLSYYLPNIRFHSRWKNLEEQDFYSKTYLGSQEKLKGYKILDRRSKVEDYIPISENNSCKPVEMVELMAYYLDEIRQLCSEKNITLILISTPYKYEDAGMNKSISLYAKEYNIPFYSFNEENIYHEINYNFATDNAENSHANINGALKITNYMGKLLKDKYNIHSRFDKQWEDTKGIINGEDFTK